MIKVTYIYAEGCHACAEAKPYYEELKSKYDKIKFEDLKFSQEVLPFYETYIPKEEMEVPATWNNGSPIIKTDGKPLMLKEMKTPLQFPNFFVFNDEEFLGNVVGLNKEQLNAVLEAVSA